MFWRIVNILVALIIMAFVFAILIYAAPADAADGQRARFVNSARGSDTIVIYPTWQSRYRLVFVGSCRGFASSPRVDIFLTDDKFEADYQARVTSDWTDADKASEIYCVD